MNRGCATLACIFLIALFCATPANAALTLCNRTGYILYAATGAKIGTGVVVTQGWTRLVPGACENAIKAPLPRTAYYLYAQTSRSYSGPSHSWGGGTSLCVTHGNFTLATPLMDGGCNGDNSFMLGFATLATHGKKDWRETLIEPDIATLNKAKTIGLQRLLNANGLKAGIPGQPPGKLVDTALTAFHKRAKLAADAGGDALFTALERAAARKAVPDGYSVCNATSEPAWAAIGTREHDGWVARGWWEVPKAGCATLIATPLATDRVYLLVERAGKSLVVSGPAKFCIADIAFEIRGRNRCKARGLILAGFAVTNTKSKTGYVAWIGKPYQTRTSK